MSSSSSTIGLKDRPRKKVDALGQRVRARFNEQIEYPEQIKTGKLRLKDGNIQKMNDQMSMSNATSKRSGFSRVQSAVLSRRSDNRQSANGSEMRFAREDQESVITTNNLKQFNIEGGTHAGLLGEEIEAIERLNAAQTLDAENEEEELRDEVASQLTK